MHGASAKDERRATSRDPLPDLDFLTENQLLCTADCGNVVIECRVNSCGDRLSVFPDCRKQYCGILRPRPFIASPRNLIHGCTHLFRWKRREGELHDYLSALNSFNLERATFFTDSTANGKIL